MSALLPEGDTDFVMNGYHPVWITVGPMSVCISRWPGRLSVDVYPLGQEAASESLEHLTVTYSPEAQT